MRDNDGRKLDHHTLEQMRLRAVDAVESGVHPEDVAASLGMARGTVYGWLARYREGGKDALKARPVPGRPPKLTGAQMRILYTLIVGADPRQYEFEFALWTRDLVRTLIRREFQVSLSAVSVGRLLRTLGLSPQPSSQRPLWRAWQAHPDAVQRWRDEQFPAIRKQAKAEGATVYFADEAGLRSDYHAGTTWAPIGRTPVVKATGARHSLNMISAVTAQGLLRFSTFTGSFTAARFIDFCRQLRPTPTVRCTWSSTAAPRTGRSWSPSSSPVGAENRVTASEMQVGASGASGVIRLGHLLSFLPRAARPCPTPMI